MLLESGEQQVADGVPGERPVTAEPVLQHRRPARGGVVGTRGVRLEERRQRMRRSPGGITASSERSRPDEPPSSATVTTAVTWSHTWRSAVTVA